MHTWSVAGVCGWRYKTHSLFSDSTKVSVMIQLFYDGLGVTNPLRGQSTLHNIGVFFYTIKNVPHRYNSCFANVHLLALCYSQVWLDFAVVLEYKYRMSRYDSCKPTIFV